MKENGGVDKRCSAVKRSDVWADKYGMPHGLGEKARGIRDLEVEKLFDNLSV